MVWNIYTIHVSPQYHVVFDDKYETIFNMGTSEEQFDAMYNVLFENSCNWYAEEGCYDDNNLVYKPPPLDKVCLLEPERQDQSAALDEQLCWQETRERQLVSDASKQNSNW